MHVDVGLLCKHGKTCACVARCIVNYRAPFIQNVFSKRKQWRVWTINAKLFAIGSQLTAGTSPSALTVKPCCIANIVAYGSLNEYMCMLKPEPETRVQGF